jgi:nicotinamidase-related amidase
VPKVATVVIDMLNPYDHEDGEALAEQVAGRIETVQGLIRATLDSDATLVYVNDNYDDFTATSDDLVRKALDGKHPELIEPIVPPDEALFIEKVRHSAFYESALNHLLHVNEIERLVLAGQVTEQCILYSALDAYIRGFDIVVARDAVVPLDDELGDAALRMMERNMSADIIEAADAFD